VGHYTGSTSVGDVFLYGGWARPGTNETTLGSSVGTNVVFQLLHGTDAIAGFTNSNYGMTLQNDWWHPIVALAEVTTGEATSHSVSLLMQSPNTSGQGNQFFQPFLIYIP